MKIKTITYDFESLEELIDSIKAGKAVYVKAVHGSFGMSVPYQKIKVNNDEKTISHCYCMSSWSTETITIPFEKLKFHEYELVENNA